MFLFNRLPSVLVIISLVLLSSAQKLSSNQRDVDPQELARQNKITKQILEAYIQKKLGLASGSVRAPSIFDILPVKKTEERTIRESMKEVHQEPEESEIEDMSDVPETPETQEYNEDDSLQSVESEQIDSIYSEGTQKVFYVFPVTLLILDKYYYPISVRTGCKCSEIYYLIASKR